MRAQLREKDAAILEREKQILAKLRESAAEHALELARTADKVALDSAISMLKNQIAMQEELANKRQAELEAKLKQRAEEVDQLRNQLSEATDHISEQAKELENARKDNEKLEELKATLQDKELTLKAKDQRIQALDSTIESLRRQVESIMSDMNSKLVGTTCWCKQVVSYYYVLIMLMAL